MNASIRAFFQGLFSSGLNVIRQKVMLFCPQPEVVLHFPQGCCRFPSLPVQYKCSQTCPSFIGICYGLAHRAFGSVAVLFFFKPFAEVLQNRLRVFLSQNPLLLPSHCSISHLCLEQIELSNFVQYAVSMFFIILPGIHKLPSGGGPPKKSGQAIQNVR